MEELQRKCVRHVRKPLSKSLLQEVKAAEAQKEKEVKGEGVEDEVKIKEEEEKLVHELVHAFEHAFAWDESEKGMFLEDYFNPVWITVMEHIPWILPNIPIPTSEE